MRPAPIVYPKRPAIAPRAAAVLVASSLTLACLAPVRAGAQVEAAAAAAEIDRVLARKEAKWQCVKLAKAGTAAAPHAPRGVYYRFQCQRRALTVLGLVFFADSGPDAARRLEWSLNDPQTFQGRPLPLTGAGEQAYQQQRPGFAAVAFRDGPVYAQVSVSVVAPVGGASPAKMEKPTAEALKTARRFAGHLLAGKKDSQ
ncbi:MAG TPA: hypothetical protein VEY09_19265 [Pyrinomonadaceae bacterium]|nr:hypothetical protein [Pyrinomonadaceae bacterium]